MSTSKVSPLRQHLLWAVRGPSPGWKCTAFTGAASIPGIIALRYQAALPGYIFRDAEGAEECDTGGFIGKMFAGKGLPAAVQTGVRALGDFYG